MRQYSQRDAFERGKTGTSMKMFFRKQTKTYKTDYFQDIKNTLDSTCQYGTNKTLTYVLI